MASPGFHDSHTMTAKVKTLINTQLKSVLKKEGLAVSGVKAAMQERIINRKFWYGVTSFRFTVPKYIFDICKPRKFRLRVRLDANVKLASAEIEQYVRNRNIEGYISLRTLINNPDGSLPNSSANPHSSQNGMPSRQSQHQYTLANGIARPALSLASAMPPQSYGTRTITR